MPKKLDGTVPSGSRKLTIDTVEYIADDFQFQKPTKFIGNTDENDEPDGGVLLADFVAGSATLQLASSTTVPPEAGDEFTEAEGTFYVCDVGHTESKGAFKKVPITFRKKINVA